METVIVVVQGLAVMGLISLGVRYGGMAIGLFGGVGVLLLALLFSVKPGPVPVSAMLIILTVVTAAGAMQLAGGVDYLVSLAQKVIRRFPRQITLVAPLTTFLFCVGAGTGNIYYSLLPVIYEVSCANRIRPERPLALSATAGQLAITSSPVSAAMAAMVGLIAPLGYKITDILIIVFPATLVAIFVAALIMNFVGKELDDDPVCQERLAAGKVIMPTDSESVKPITPEGKRSAWFFLAGVGLIVLVGLFDVLRPLVMDKGKLVPIDMSLMIQIVMFTAASAIVLFSKVKPADIPKSTLFDSGMVAVVALFGVAWMANTFIGANEAVIVGGLSDLAKTAPLMIALALFLVAALTTSQSSATLAIIPIGITLGIPPAYLVAMWPAVIGVFLLPANGAQIATVEMDLTGSTRIGKLVLNHSFLLPVLVTAVVAIAVGLLTSWVMA